MQNMDIGGKNKRCDTHFQGYTGYFLCRITDQNDRNL